MNPSPLDPEPFSDDDLRRAEGIRDRLREVRDRIDSAARRAGRDPSEVLLVAATKQVSAADVRHAIEAGVHACGENRAQELIAKAQAIACSSGVTEVGVATAEPRGTQGPSWHFIGHLQRNKVRALAPWVQVWQTVDRPELAETIAKWAPGALALVEVNIDQDPAKAGCAPGTAERVVNACREHGLRVAGLMTVPTFGADPRGAFRRLYELADSLGLPELSMGMSEDYEVAVEEGSTHVRIGRAIFGRRTPP